MTSREVIRLFHCDILKFKLDQSIRRTLRLTRREAWAFLIYTEAIAQRTDQEFMSSDLDGECLLPAFEAIPDKQISSTSHDDKSVTPSVWTLYRGYKPVVERDSPIEETNKKLSN